MNFSNGSRGWEKSKVGGGGAQGWGKMSGERDQEICLSTSEQGHATLFSCLKRATTPPLRDCQGVINLARSDVITLMDTGLVEHFISTRAVLRASSPLHATSNFPQVPPLPLY